MSVLMHRCRACGHATGWHEPRSRGYSSCSCCNRGAAQADPAPQLQQTYGHPGGRPEPLYPPGSTRNSGTMHASTTCDCGACRAAYDRLQQGESAAG
ncbi:hypothetical protein FB554_0859 [Barrientosiimonas humi]|uniref:Uncharacterized protein n=1 Tax=Barrientosiimonas humi TaxID=999931 RepID=A0A542XA77_9MICO|nr:hypothetical protein [Barrientosiimonas humi]TQL32727.1 hypothetical protein FB554_0859 [Barrientosiimonas humi]CAG7572718.1 hypothetical protein BH39T_PBIAJDOK_01341 [Barrientosiimonas humi]